MVCYAESQEKRWDIRKGEGMSTKRNLPIMGYERPYYADLDYHPFIFYIIFGVNAEELVVLKERHRVDEFPKGLDLSFLKKPAHCDYMNAMLGGTLGKVLNDNYPSGSLQVNIV